MEQWKNDEVREGRAKGTESGAGQAICVVSDLKAAAISVTGMKVLVVGGMYRYRQLVYSNEIC